LIFLAWVILSSIFFGSYAIYFLYLKTYANRPWNLKIDQEFHPHISILIPAHNEEENIVTKLEDVSSTRYPREKIEIILVDDASTDGTLNKTYEFIKSHPEAPIKIVKQKVWKGKSSALNEALKIVVNDIVIVTDADSTWSEDILYKALPYLADPQIGALTGRVKPRNIDQNWVTKAEDDYLDLISLVRLGESKIHSTIRFEGCFCAYKKKSFVEFDTKSGADDSGTALNITQNKFRTILVPEAVTLIDVPHDLKQRIRTKARRATHLTELWIKCLKLLLKGQLSLPKRIAMPELIISIVNPIIFICLIFVTIIMMMTNPIFLISVIIGLILVSLSTKARSYAFEGILDHFILFYSLILYGSRKKIMAWE
jgi:cellulose synthase/poly-beta-1,6-N-acetylglucosamine synthase-like glycosyltransferase